MTNNRILTLLAAALLLFCRKDAPPGKELSFNMMQTTRSWRAENGIDAQLTASFSYPHFYGNAAADSLNRFVKELIVVHTLNEPADVEIEDAAQWFVDQFREYIIKSDYSQNWELKISIDVIYQSPKVWTLRLDTYRFTGEAHGNSYVELIVFDPRNGQRLLPEDFTDRREALLLQQVAESKFREQHQIPADASLEETGFWFEEDQFYLTGNFGVTKEGFLFIYNPYEIAPYALGRTELLITWEELRPFLKPTNPLSDTIDQSTE
ncbi:MAG: DUF3298 and DUF4163 domain-containing protein [candidate division KSB1 bacterium]|nr:DUF3298 and DUF4163 domain-containing protein [candidate division KSB1 bacterium]MDZ7345735.1 DUF3298 and DUF4163 domain-containing protein [candidate division KSB1 bacterium]